MVKPTSLGCTDIVKTALDTDFIQLVNSLNTPAQYFFGRKFQAVAPNGYDLKAIEQKPDQSDRNTFIYALLVIPATLFGQILKLFAYIFCEQYRGTRQLVDLGIKLGMRIEWLPPPVVGSIKVMPAG